MTITLSTLAASTSAITFADFGNIILPAHPSSLILDDDYGFTEEEIRSSKDIKAAIDNGLATLTLSNGNTVTAANSDAELGDFSSPLPRVLTVADEAARLALTSLKEGDEVVQTDDGTQWIYDGTNFIPRIDISAAQEVETVLINVDATNNAFYPFSTGETWAQVKQNYSRLIISGFASQVGSADIKPYSSILEMDAVSTVNNEPGLLLRFDDAYNNVRVFINTPQNGDVGFRYRGNGDVPTSGRSQFKVVGIKNQKVLVKSLPLLDEDDMASNSDAAAPTQQSVVEYVNATVGQQVFVVKTVTGSDTTINYNSQSALTAVFSQIDVQSANNTMTQAANGGVDIAEAGLYRVEATIPHRSTGIRASLMGWIRLNNTEVSARAFSYIRNSAGHVRDTFNLVTYVNANAGDNINVALRRAIDSTVSTAINIDFNAKLLITKIS